MVCVQLQIALLGANLLRYHCTSCLEGEAGCFSARLGDLARRACPQVWLIDLIYRACACMLPHISPAWRDIVFVLVARPLRRRKTQACQTYICCFFQVGFACIESRYFDSCK